MGPIVVVAVDPAEVDRDVGAALQAVTGLTGCWLEVHHPNTTPGFVGVTARRDGVAIGDVFNPISGTRSESDESAENAE